MDCERSHQNQLAQCHGHNLHEEPCCICGCRGSKRENVGQKMRSVPRDGDSVGTSEQSARTPGIVSIILNGSAATALFGSIFPDTTMAVT